MPSGDEAYERKQREMAARKQSFDDGPNVRFFGLQGGTFAHVRFLEQGTDLTFADTHRVPIQGKQRRFFRNFVCRNLYGDGTPCPLCQSTVPAIARAAPRGYLNLIWREGPVYQVNEKGFPLKDVAGNKILVGREDQIALWECSWTVFEQLKEKDRRYQGLMSRDWEIKREGTDADNTKYFIEPVVPDGGPQPMQIADLALAQTKYDLAALLVPKAFDVLQQVIVRGAAPIGEGPQPTYDRGALLGQPAASVFQPGQSAGAGDFTRSSAFTRG